MKLKNFTFGIISILIGFFVALLIAEAICKVLDVQHAHKKNRLVSKISYISDIPGVRFEMAANISTTTPGYTGDRIVHTDRYGFRSSEVSREKPDDVYRIAILGDSIAFGRTLPQNQIFSEVLKANMNAGEYKKKVEVINASLAGRDTWEEYAILKHRVIDLDPDLVVLQICLNDHIRLPFPKKDSLLGVFGERSWYSYSSLLSLLDKKVKGFRALHVKWIKKLGLDRRSTERVILDHYIDPEQMLGVEDHWDDWSSILLEIHNLSKASGAETLFIIFPLAHQIKLGMTETMPILTEFLQQNGISFLDMIGPFSREKKIPLSDYTHPNKKGHSIVARFIEDYIRSHQLLMMSKCRTISEKIYQEF